MRQLVDVTLFERLAADVAAAHDHDVTMRRGGPGLDNVQVDIAMVQTPDGHGRLELTKVS